MSSKRVLMALFALTVFAACAVPLLAQEVEIPVRCNGEVCLVPQKALQALMEAHNEHVVEIARLEALTKGCVTLKKDRDA